ncbi:protein of unknown function [Thauera humireducens]|nr:protein of unknown function [Thauera humireducens]
MSPIRPAPAAGFLDPDQKSCAGRSVASLRYKALPDERLCLARCLPEATHRLFRTFHAPQ